jgi:hypothetical protein
MSKVAVVRDARVLEGGAPDRERLHEMVSWAILRTTAAESPEKAWASLFSSDDVVAIKVNCFAAPGQKTHLELVDEILEGLECAGVKRCNVIIYEWKSEHLSRGGYTEERFPGVRLMSSDAAGYLAPMTLGAATFRLTVLLDGVSAIINAPVLKDHMLAGVTAALKNHYGSIEEPAALHGNNCDPYIADLNSAPILRGKHRLVICDALRARYEGGPYDETPHKWVYGGLIASADPVAVDALGADIIEQRRRTEHLPSLAKRGTPPKWIHTATERGLGFDSREKMDLMERVSA